MVKIRCAVVGKAPSDMFSVEMNPDQQVNDLKGAVKDEPSAMITCNSWSLQLVLAKKDGRWLTENYVLDGKWDTDDRTVCVYEKRNSLILVCQRMKCESNSTIRSLLMDTALRTCW
ncbi:hypothetical protein PPTG_15301 [Phytophthora nicotianae INRA-310]|uniref:Crinkler effector protein N-terminal domain-containing protein n=1 Tax=Phytophthora nicotianae (strain INRA-310) TaxID=761204 RepID=W2PV67_PHYN3|nr:hypothetical protein PPTG_15301 [Phytophthora nicotianae INRA-310]ETN04124.1 hypothetical protein PPTG_15301 [Phytophthora nicotianae INRA-310]